MVGGMSWSTCRCWPVCRVVGTSAARAGARPGQGRARPATRHTGCPCGGPAMAGWAPVEGTEVRKLAALEDTHWWYRERRHLLGRSIQGLRPGRALDIGAAGGGNTRVLRDAGWTVAALEYGADGAQVAAERGLAVLRADATALPVDRDSLDLVVAFDVLEHIPDHDRAVAEVRRVLRPDGRFLVAVPADPRLWSEHDVAVDHVRRYTRVTLRAVLERGGFTLDS